VKSTFLGVSAAVIGIGMAVAGCSSGGHSTATTATGHKAVGSTKPASNHSPMAASSATPAMTGTVGYACKKLPATGTGSLHAMMSEPTGTAISHNPQLTELARGIDKAGLTTMLNSATTITVFAPDDAALRALGSGNLKTLMANKTDLVKLLEYHMVKSQVTPADFAARTTLTTLVGLPARPAKSGTDYRVNTALVTCGNIHTANGTVYIIDKVLIPTP
jgi:uncharacterized surface protein with fasciclin (FAS1) repeats